jgi:PAS domain S-box-containing protein
MTAAVRCAVAIGWLTALASPLAHADVPPAPGPDQAGAHARATGELGGLGDLPVGQSRVRVFAGADGLRNLVIISIAQDEEGFLWIGTEDGVYRFDGERFTHFSVDEGLSSSLVHVVGVAPDGGVCVGTGNGLVCWDGMRFSRAHTLGLPAIPVQTMATYAGKLWVGTDGGGLYVQNDAGVFVPAPGWPGSPTTTVRALWADAGGLVVGDDATVELSAGNGAWRNIGEVGLGRDRVEGVLRDRAGALWIRTPSHMWYLTPSASRATDLHDGLPTGFDATGAPNAMAIGPRGNVLIGTDDGITYRDHDRWRTLGRAVGLPAATTRAVLVDRDDTIWIGSAGLFELRGRGLFEHYNVASGLPGEIVWTYQRDRQGTLWVGTNRCLARAIAGRWECLPGTFGRVVRSVVFPPQGGMFVGGAPSDLLYFDAAGHRTALGAPDRPDKNILGLTLGPEGDLWVGTMDGLYRLPGGVPGALEQVVVPGTQDSARFGSILVVGDQLWATAAPGGVAVLDHGAWHLFGADDGFRDSSMSYMTARRDGRLCTGYTEAIGLTCFRYGGGAVSGLQHITPSDGLGTGKVYFLGEDREQRLWVGTGGGVDVVTPLGIDHFDDSDGLAGNDSASKAFLLDRDGSLWLGATGGATHVLAQYYGGPPRAPRTALLDGRLGDQPIRNARATLEVPHDRNALTLEFAAGTLLDPKRVEYQVRLSPETEWSPSHQRQARYPALLPGTYRFEVRARIDAGGWGPATELRFAVRPAWWQTGWFLALIGLSGLAAIGAGFAWRQRTVLRRRTRQLHEQSDASFRAVIDLMPDLISVYRDRTLIYVNLANRRFLGFDRPRARWDDVDLIDRVHPDDREQIAELLARVASLPPQQASDIVEIRMRGAEASWRTCEVSAILVEIGDALTVVASGRDVTERQRLRAKLLVSDRMASLGTLAAGIAHEINNPLAYVAGNLEAVSESLRTAPGAAVPAAHAELAFAIGEARDGAERVRKIVQGLRLFSRSEDEQRVPLALAGVLEAAIRLTSNEIRHRAQLVRELGPVPLVVADDSRLTQVFINLLVNAAHAIPEGRSDGNRITVRTRTNEQGRAVVEIEDTGKGIAPDLMSRVFDPFFTTKDIGGGTGLGLSICHGIISGLGGQITIESATEPAPRVGTVVRVVLPAAADLAASVSPAIAEDVPAATAERRRRVLLVDDEALVAHTMERLLRRDFDITIALCGQDALDHVTKGARFDAIISDVMMPNMTGIELLEELQRMAPDQAQRLIFLSGGAFTARTRERLDQLGVLQLEKPVSAKELRACVMRIVNSAGPPP